VLRTAKEVQQAAQEVASAPTPRRRRQPAAEPERPIGTGDRVEVRRLNAVGQVVSEPNEKGEVEIQLGGLRTRANVRELTRVTRREAEARSPVAGRPAERTPVRLDSAVRLPAPRAVNLEIDVRGTRADEVVPRVEQYLSDAYLSSMPFVRVIHGKGTGVLRQIIRDYLRGNPMVQSYQPAGPADGGEGATIVKLAV
jgi:DNA mismatch repair protein MutS2